MGLIINETQISAYYRNMAGSRSFSVRQQWVCGSFFTSLVKIKIMTSEKSVKNCQTARISINHRGWVKTVRETDSKHQRHDSRAWVCTETRHTERYFVLPHLRFNQWETRFCWWQLISFSRHSSLSGSARFFRSNGGNRRSFHHTFMFSFTHWLKLEFVLPAAGCWQHRPCPLGPPRPPSPCSWEAQQRCRPEGW